MKQTSLLYSLYFSFTFYFRVWLGSSPWVALEFSSLVCILIALSTKAPLTSRPLLQFKCLLPFSGTTIIATLFLALPVFLPHSHFYAAVRVIDLHCLPDCFLQSSSRWPLHMLFSVLRCFFVDIRMAPCLASFRFLFKCPIPTEFFPEILRLPLCPAPGILYHLSLLFSL